MTFTTIQEAMNKGTGKVAIRGWVYRERGSAKIKFIVLRDSTNIIQCVIEKAHVGEKEFEIADKIKIESSLEIIGTIKKDDRAPTGYEVHVKEFKVVGFAREFPITKDQSTEWLRDQRHLWLRSRKMVATMKIRATVMEAFREHYRNKGFFEYAPPVLQPTQCEGGSTLFEVKYYTDKMYLTQSAQLYSEAMIFALDKVFLIGPCFRAEKHKTSRHLSEFWMAEMEAAWYDLDDLQDDVEELLRYIVVKVLEKNQEDLKVLGRDTTKLEAMKKPFKRMTYTEVLEFLKEKEGMEVVWGKDLRTIEEDALSKHHDVPVIVSRYPKDIMAFYKPEDPKDKKVALCIDVIAPEGYGEIIGGSQRSLDIEDMKAKLERDGEKTDQYDWYFDLRRYGNTLHSGHGMGVERVVAWICGLEDIKDSIPFPRTMIRYKP